MSSRLSLDQRRRRLQQLQLCTIIAKNYLAQARVLAESFLHHHPSGEVTVLVIDDFEGYIDPDAEPFELIGIDSIGLDDYEEMAASYDVTELSTAVKPWLLRTLLDRPDCDAVTYLDPDIWILDEIEEVGLRTLSHGLVLNPHFAAPPARDGLKPSEEDILIAGTYNLGFISLASGPRSDRLLDWWSQRLRRKCLIDPANGYFVDQRWIDLVPGFWPGLHLLRDPGYNLAYWNLPIRELRYEGERYTVDGEPLRFFHFSGFDPLRPEELSKHQNRIDVSSSPPLARICGAYADAVVAAGYEEARGWPYRWDELPGGVRLDQYSRRLYRQALSESRLNGSVFSRKGASKLVAYLTEPDDQAPASSGISRYLGEIRNSREDLRKTFPDLAGQGAARFREWVQLNADALDIPPALRPGETTGRSTSGHRSGLPPIGGVNLAGYLGSELGVGEAARQLSSAMSAAGVKSAMIDLPPHPAEMAQRLRLLREDETPFGVNLVCVNADMVPEFAAAVGPSFFADRYSVGMWFWEIGRLPVRSRGSFDHVDEVWVASRHVADAIQPDASVPVEVIRLPVTPHAPDRADRAALGMPDGYCFLFVFDYRSVLKRKNPLGLIESFSRAFEADSGVSLVIKAVGAEDRPEEAALLREAAAAHPNVHLVETVISHSAKNAMIASCDCYVSLHRAEGFGLTLAEAMYFGKPVIATGYSGNLDFMTDENSYLVGHAMTDVGDGAEPYSAEAIWAEPDLDHAATLMRRVSENKEEAAAKGERAAADLRRTHSPEEAGTMVEARLKEISERSAELTASRPSAPEPPRAGELARAQPMPPGNGTGRAHLQHLLEFEQPPPKPSAGRLRRAGKRIYLRLLRPYVAYQQRINESTARALDEVKRDLERRSAAAEQRGREELDESITKVETLLRVQAEDVSASLDSDRARFQEIRDLQVELAATVGAAVEELKRGLKAQGAATDSTVSDLQAHVEKLAGETKSTFEGHHAAIGDLQARAADAEGVVEAAAAAPFMADNRFDTSDQALLGKVLGFSDRLEGIEEDPYRSFEDLFRGSEEMIKERQRVYLNLVRGFAPVLDVGCGRGEFLDLLKEAEMEYLGIDIDPGMVARCHEKGHSEVIQTDLLEHLDQSPADHLGTVFCAHVIEHLGSAQLERFLKLGLKALRPGGLFISETINPHSPRALKTFWVDPTHHSPLFPETMLALFQLAGYASAFVFCPNGSGDYDRDRRSEGEYAIVARAPEGDAKP